MGEVVDNGMTIDELARAAGVTTRSIRAYQTSGLLPHPRLAGRVGVYDDGHLARLRYIGHLQERGFSLAAIRDLLTAWEEGRSLSDVLGFEDALTAPWTDEAPGRVDADQLRRLFPDAEDEPGFVRRAVDLGLLVPDGDGWRVPSPTLLKVGSELVAAGIPLAAVLDEHALLRFDVARVAERFVALFEHHVWEPFVMAGLPADRLPEVTEALLRVRPMAIEAVRAVLGQAMEEAVAASTSRQISRLGAAAPLPEEAQQEAL
ncbi:MAG TPA: MerR family transcriptional regulator [Acidimicrobiales bacterium]|nr:MerR family transcriptional regulator [Acidimicrobiales bacterium]